MDCIPTIETERLVLRAFTLADARRVQELAGDRRVAATTALIPHPYPDGAAEAFISRHQAQAEKENHFTFAVTFRATGELIGCVGIGEDRPHRRAELGYWMGVPFWGQGYCTEAAQAVVGFAFERLAHLKRVSACHFGNNPASGRVMQKIGLIYEGTRVKHVLKWNELHDLVLYGILREQWEEKH